VGIFGDEYRVVGSTKVLVSGRQAGAGRESGAAVEDALFSVWTLRDRRAVHLSFDRDRQRALEAAVLRE
jgi:hypothetical protein